jgi:hypothetical protein
MKKSVMLSAILAMSLSSFVFAADDVPPPPKHPVTHDGKNPQHRDDHQKKDGKEWKNDKKDHRDAPPKHDGKAQKHDGKKPPLPPEDKR